MGLFNKLFSAATAAPRLVGTLLNKDKKLSDFKLFDNQKVSDSYKESVMGNIAVGTAAFGGSKLASAVVKSPPIKPLKDMGNTDLGNLFSNGASLSSIVKNSNLVKSTGIDFSTLFQGGKTVPKKTFDNLGGSLEFGSQGQKNLFLPFAMLLAGVIVVIALFRN